MKLIFLIALAGLVLFGVALVILATIGGYNLEALKAACVTCALLAVVAAIFEAA